MLTTPKMAVMYIARFIGSIPIPAKVEAVVIATDSDRSVLKSEHHQFEKLPPGELVTTRRMMPWCSLRLNIWQHMKPINGMTKNWHPSPTRMPVLFRNCRLKSLVSTVPAIPNTSRNSKALLKIT